MDGFIHELLAPILAAGNPAIMAILLLIAGGCSWIYVRREIELKKEQKVLIDTFQKQIEEDRRDLLTVIDKYQEGQISVVQALNELRVLIATIGAKL
jgi:hypothetical protein